MTFKPILRRCSTALLLAPACLAMTLGTPTVVDAELKRSTFVYKTVGDVEIRADVYRPDVSGKRPVIAWFHGGALITGSRNPIGSTTGVATPVFGAAGFFACCICLSFFAFCLYFFRFFNIIFSRNSSSPWIPTFRME